MAQAAILALTVAMRFYRLADLPVGMHYDEAYNGLDATAILGQPLYHWPVYFTGNFGREPLHVYLVAAAQAVLGPGVPALRSVSAVCSALLGPALAWLAWELAPSLGADRRRLSLWAAAAPLTLLWSQVLSRYATRNLPLALLETLMWAALWRAWHTRRPTWWLVAGVLGGLSLYTYLPARLLPLVLAVLAAVAWRRQRAAVRQQTASAALGASGAAITAAPLALFLLRHPEWLLTRVSQVSALGEGWPQTLARNVVAVLGMAFVTGDANVRNNIPGRPIFDAVMSVAFVAGLAWLLLRARRPACLFLMAWLGVMLVPTALSGDAPHFLRAVGALPAFALIVAVGLDGAATWCGRRWPNLRPAVVAAGWAAMAASAAITWHAFANVWAVDPSLYYARDAGLLAVTQALRDEPAPAGETSTTYLSPSGWDHPTIRYGLVGADPPLVLHGFDGRVCVRVPQGMARYVVLSDEDFRGLALLRTYLPESEERALVFAPDGEALAVELVQPESATVVYPEMTALAVGLADGIGLDGYWLSADGLRPGERLYVRLWWRAEQTPEGRYTAFAHLLTATAGSGMREVAGVDAEPGKSTCATDGWLPGETVVDEMELVVPEALTGGQDYWIAVGLYSAATGERLAVSGYADDEVLIGPLAVADSG